MAAEPGGRPLPAPGDVLAGKYEVEHVIGSGGMGVVVAARHLELDERVAVKFLLPEAVQSQEAAQRFVREARAAVKIKSEHVARVIDVGRLENGAPYMVMEYLEGRDLSQRVREGQVAIEDAVDFVIQACEAMAGAHSIGIVHRDLKPANLFLTQRSDGEHVIKVLDFGISKVSVPDLSGASLTRTSTAMGSPLYMSPEQMRSAKDVDVRTDIWSLGTILYELLTGATPFRALTYPELCAKIMAEPPVPLRDGRPDIPEALERVIQRCLQKNPAERFANVAELTAALAPFAPKRSRATIERVGRVLARAGISSSNLELPASLPAAAVIAASASDGGTKTSWADTAAPRAKRSRAILALAVVVVASLAVVLAFALLRTKSEPEPAATLPTDSAVAAASPPAPTSASIAPPLVAPPPPTVSVVPAPPPAVPTTPKVVHKKPAAPTAKTAAAPPPPTATTPPKPTKNPLDIGIK